MSEPKWNENFSNSTILTYKRFPELWAFQAVNNPREQNKLKISNKRSHLAICIHLKPSAV